MIEYTSAIPGQSTAGVMFVIAFPLYDSNRGNIGQIQITTEEEYVFVSISIPPADKTSNLPESESERFLVTWDGPNEYEIGNNLNLDKSGIYLATVLRSTGPTRVLAYTKNIDKTSADEFRVMPWQSCYKSYYVTTAIGHPFMMVFAFATTTTVDVDIPKYKTMDFNVKCGLKDDCKTGSTVSAVINSYHVWYFSIAEINRQFQNILITSNYPIFVVSGNTHCFIKYESLKHSSSYDVCIASMKPTETWGKEYFVPRFSFLNKNVRLLLRMNAVNFPLEVYIYQKGLEQKKVNIVSHQEIYEHEASKDPIFVTADVPFGLYLLIPASELTSFDSGLLNVIPVEQWMHGIALVSTLINQGERSSFYLVTQTATQDVDLPDYTNDINWTLALKADNTSYYYAEPNLYAIDTFIFSKNPSVKIMLYVHRSLDRNIGRMFMPYDFYQGIIYNSDCKKFPSVSNDGVDNDCDGKIDEEVKNNKDDDGDGDIDEDNVEAFENGQWSEWDSACFVQGCVDTNFTLDVRACDKKRRSRFGKRCDGSLEQCKPLENNECPDLCDTQKTITKCKCLDGCTDCTNKVHFCLTQCKPGYFSTRICSTKCPEGWNGPGCAFGPGNNIAVDNTLSSSWSSTILVLCLLLLLLALAIAYFCLAKRKQAEEKLEEELQQPNEKPEGDNETIGSEEGTSLDGEDDGKKDDSKSRISGLSRSSWRTSAATENSQKYSTVSGLSSE